MADFCVDNTQQIEFDEKVVCGLWQCEALRASQKQAVIYPLYPRKWRDKSIFIRKPSQISYKVWQRSMGWSLGYKLLYPTVYCGAQLLMHAIDTCSWQQSPQLQVVIKITSNRWNSWWRHQMETFSALLAICAGNSPGTGEFPAQRPVTRSFHVFFDLNKPLSKQSWGCWFETPSRQLWRHCNGPFRWAKMGALDEW